MGRLIRQEKEQEQGFTLIELLVVIAILAIVVVIAVPSITGAMGRGGDSVYNEDKHNIWTTLAAFWSDVRHGPYNDSGIWRWGDVDGQSPDHYFPTANGRVTGIRSSEDITDGDNSNPILFLDIDADGGYDSGEAVSDDDIASAAIWMGLLVNAAKEAADPGDSNRGTAAPVTGDGDLYIIEYPKSSSVKYNGNLWSDKGTYTWIIGKSGQIHGAYKKGGSWYSGFSGAYP